MSLLLFLAATYMAVRSLVSLVLRRRDQLSQLLVEHVKNSRAEQKKKLQILAFRKKMREKKAEEASRAHPDENDSSSKAA